MSKKHMSGGSLATVVESPKGFAAWSHKRRLMLMVLLVMLIVVLVVGGVMLTSRRKAVAPAGLTPAEKHTQVMDQSTKLDNTGDFTAETKALKDYLATNPAQTESNQASMKLAAAYINTEDYDQAIVYLQKVQTSGDKNYEIGALNGLGMAYAAKGDKVKAIDYYQQAVKIYEQRGDTYHAGSNQKIIDKLQAQP